MTEKEMYEFFDITEKESKLHLPNVIFDELQAEFKGKKANHIGFAYSYVYYITWMWRYTKYGVIDSYDYVADKTSHTPLKPLAKRVMGLSESNKTYDYIVKKGGVLESLGYTEQVKFAPVALREGFKREAFGMNDIADAYVYENEFDETINRKSNKPDRPVRGYHSSLEALEYGILDGTFYESHNSHNVPVEAFVKCMTNENLGTIAFYVYGLLCHKTDMFKQGYNASRDALVSLSGLPKSTISKVLKALEEEGLISVNHAKFIVDKPHGVTTPANTFWVKRGGFVKTEVKENKPMSWKQYIASGGQIIDRTEKVDEFEEFLPWNRSEDSDVTPNA
jgi:DNA-binding transcriptional ArsR family regulator